MNPISQNYGLFLAALCIWREARGESREAKVGVAQVIFARVADPRWPNTPGEVVLQKLQFSSFNKTDPNSWKFPTPADSAWLESCDVVQATRPILGLPEAKEWANHYHSLPEGQEPSWADPTKLTATIGAFRFYRL